MGSACVRMPTNVPQPMELVSTMRIAVSPTLPTAQPRFRGDSALHSVNFIRLLVEARGRAVTGGGAIPQSVVLDLDLPSMLCSMSSPFVRGIASSVKQTKSLQLVSVQRVFGSLVLYRAHWLN